MNKDDMVRESLAYLKRKHRKGMSLGTSRETGAYLCLHAANREQEVFTVLFLNTRNQIIACEDMFHGTIDGTSVHPREVAKRALHHNAAALILCHNHPSGILEPSQADRAITKKLKEALALVDVRVLDHFVIGHGEWYSFADKGLI